jgi:hypothetical protein
VEGGYPHSSPALSTPHFVYSISKAYRSEKQPLLNAAHEEP